VRAVSRRIESGRAESLLFPILNSLRFTDYKEKAATKEVRHGIPVQGHVALNDTKTVEKAKKTANFV
jgi:hypothetical protein